MDAVDALRIPEFTTLPPVFQNHARRRKFNSMSEGQCGAGAAEPVCNLPGAPVELERGPAAQLANDLNLKPVDPVADAGPQRLGPGLFGGKSGRKALRRVLFLQAIGLFGGGIYLVQEALAKAINRPLDALDLDHVDP